MINCFCSYVKISRRDRQESIVISHLKSTAYRNKISFKLGYRAVNARKYVRCARTFYLVFPLSLKLMVVHMTKKIKNLIFSKMAPKILIKFCGFIVYSKPNNITLSAIPEKIPETRKIVLNFLSVA